MSDHRIREANVALVGVGGLGCPAALGLAAAGIGMITLIDPDRVELSNLPRQILYTEADIGRAKVTAAGAALRSRHPRTAIVERPIALTTDSAAAALEGADFIVDATDGVATKLMINDLAVRAGHVFCHAGVVGFRGQLLTVVPGRTACVRCVFPDVANEVEAGACSVAGVVGPIAGLIGALQASHAVAYLAGTQEIVLARALQLQRRLDESQRVYEEAIALRPAYVDAHRDLAQLVWMRTGDKQEALRRLDKAIRAAPRQAALHFVRSVVLEFAGDRAAGLAAAETGLAKAGNDAALLQQAARLAAEGGAAERALDLARRAVQLAPAALGARSVLCEVLLASGRLDEAAAIAAALCTEHPLNQYALALQATVWRLQGDSRYGEWYDYATLVVQQALDVPPGYTRLESFLDELVAEVDSLHSFRTHPLQQSVRGGSQLQLQPPELERPLIGALFRAIGAAVQEYLARLGPGADPLRSRNTGKALFTGAWSVRLTSGGHHADHVHPHGWLSSACHIALPPTVGSGETRDGWLRFGKPNFVTLPALLPDHYAKPQAGRLVLFPAYMWHGVEPFASDKPRLSVAFDVVPA